MKFSVYVVYSFGAIRRLPDMFNSYYSDYEALGHEFNRRWLRPGDEERTNVPSIPTSGQRNSYPNLSRAYSTYNYSQLRVADGSFIRLKHVSLGYRLPASVARQLHLQSAKIQVSLTNPFLLYSDKRLHGQDPEYFRSGGVSLPTPRQCTFTLQLGL